jgi:hypothetical protein
MITDWVAELIGKYSFIEKSEIKGTYLLLYYRHNNLHKIKKISIRANKKQLITIIEGIKHDIGYYEEKKERDIKVRESVEKDKNKPLIFSNT